MTLYQKLQKASSEEDVTDAYIKALQARNAGGDFAPVSFKGVETRCIASLRFDIVF